MVEEEDQKSGQQDRRKRVVCQRERQSVVNKTDESLAGERDKVWSKRKTKSEVIERHKAWSTRQTKAWSERETQSVVNMTDKSVVREKETKRGGSRKWCPKPEKGEKGQRWLRDGTHLSSIHQQRRCIRGHHSLRSPLADGHYGPESSIERDWQGRLRRECYQGMLGNERQGRVWDQKE